jgi:hypothetical protein
MRKFILVLTLLCLALPVLAQQSAISPFYFTTATQGAPPSGYTDNFNRTNATDLGANWTVNYGGLEIYGNVVQGYLGAGNEAHYSAGTFANDQYSQVKLVWAVVEGYQSIGAIARAATGARTYYYSVFEPYDGHLYVGKWVAGVNYEWDEGVIAFTTGQTLRLEVTGQDGSISLVTKQNGTIVNTQADTNPNSLGYINSGKAGISCYSDYGVSQVDDWAGGGL